MTIYITDKNPHATASAASSIDSSTLISNHLVIANIFDGIKTSILRRNLEDSFKLTTQLGANFTDKRIETLFMKTFFSLNVRFEHSLQSGVLLGFLGKSTIPYSVFKIGRKRANLELFAHEFSKILYLERYSIPGTFCTLKNPPVPLKDSPDGEDLFEELFSGHAKKLKLNKTEGKQFVVGILEPFIPKEPTSSLTEIEHLAHFAKMILLSLSLGLRDAKSDGHIDYRLIDMEECMPNILDPKDPKAETAVPATDLPVLDTPLSEQILSPEIVDELKSLTELWDVETIAAFLTSKEIQYADSIAESYAPKGFRHSLSLDEGNCFFNWIPSTSIGRQASPSFTGYSVKSIETKKLFDDDQIKACIERIFRIKNFIKTHDSFTILDIVFATDPFYQIAYNYLKKECPSISENLHVQLSRISPFAAAGHYSPNHLRALTES